MRSFTIIILFGCHLAACGDPSSAVSPLASSESPVFSKGGAPVPFTVTFVIDGVCSFPVEAELSGKEKLILHPTAGW